MGQKNKLLALFRCSDLYGRCQSNLASASRNHPLYARPRCKCRRSPKPPVDWTWVVLASGS